MATQTSITPLRLGERAPDFELPAVGGTVYSLASFKDQKLLVVIFSANHCPYVGAWEDRMIAIAREYYDRGVGFAVISCNDVAKHHQDSPEEMRKRAEEKGYPFPYLYDEDQSASRRFGPSRTPEVFLFDEERRLRYHGAIDSDWEESSGMQHYLREALTSLLNAVPIMAEETPPVGCRIAWKSP